MLTLDDGRNSTSRSKLSRQDCTARLNLRHEIVQDCVGHFFVEDALVTKFLQIHFQAFQLNANFVRNVLKGQQAKIWLACFGANRRELRAGYLNHVVALWKLVLKRL